MSKHIAPLVLAAMASAAALLSAGAASAVPGPINPVPLKNYAVSDLTGFTSPSGNIGCIIDSDSVRCDIRDRDWAPPAKPADCPDVTGFGQGLTLSAGGKADFVCAGDTTLTSGPPLAYGDSITAGSLQCEINEAGIECRNLDHGSGFSLSRQGYELY